MTTFSRVRVNEREQKVPVCLKRLMEDIIKPVARKLGIKKVGWHMLRHWNSTTMDEEGFSSKVRQERLGHASTTVTDKHYTHVRDTVSRKAAEAIDRRLQATRRRSRFGKKKQLLREIVGTNVGTEAAAYV
jgi:integrase